MAAAALKKIKRQSPRFVRASNRDDKATGDGIVKEGLHPRGLEVKCYYQFTKGKGSNGVWILQRN